MATVTPVTLEYNTVYLIEDGGERVLIDTGPDYRGAFDAILTALGGRLPDLVVATHAHSDHAGLGAAWQRRGVPVAIGAADAPLTKVPQFRDPGESAALQSWVAGAGAPAEVVSEVSAGLARRQVAPALPAGEYPAAGSPARWPTGLRFEPYEAGRVLQGDCSLPAGLRAWACPGHTPGNLVVVHERDGWLFSGDQLLPEITPTPAVQFLPPSWEVRFASLPAFLRSTERLAGGSFARCYPGHGAPFTQVAALVESTMAQVETRTEKVLDELRTGGPATLFGLSERLYRRAVQRRFWQIAATVQGHLDLLAERGLVVATGGEYRTA